MIDFKYEIWSIKKALQKMQGCLVLLPLLDLNQRPSD